MDSLPLLSIAIPTKNRFNYLNKVLNVLVKIDSDEIEFVVQDNSDCNEEILKSIKSIDDKRIKYFYSKEKLSVVDNSNLSVERAKGEFVCVIGDDDIVSEHILNVAKWMKMNKVDSCIGADVRYFWPDIIFARHKFYPLTISQRNFLSKKIDAKKELKKCLDKGAVSLENMPKVYHAIVSQKALNKLNDITGSYFPGPSPDMANAIGLSFVVKTHYLINIPFVISGHSYKSAGGMGTRGKHAGDLKSITWLPTNIDEIWDVKIPKVWTAQTIYAVSAIGALNLINKSMIEKFNYQYHYAAFVNYNRHLSGVLFCNKLNFSINYLLFIIYYFSLMVKRGGNFFANFMETRMSITKNIVYKDVKTIEAAFQEVNKLKYEKL